MSEIWYEFELKMPPLVTVPSNKTKFVNRVQMALKGYFQQHDEQEEEFAQTAALLSRLMARRKNSFRRMIGFRAIRKLNAALCRLLRVDLTRDLQRFRSALPDMTFAENENSELPTRNNFDYVLVRLVSVHCIHQRIRDCCTEAAEYFAKMMRNNFFMDINTLFLANLSKIYSQSGIMANKCVDLYCKLLPYRASFPQVGNYEFLPVHCELPLRLEAFTQADLSNSDSPPSTNATIQMASPKIATASILKSHAPVLMKHQQKADVGTAIQRGDKKDTTFSIAQLKTVEDVKRFIAAENLARKRSLKNCMTKQMLNHEWMGAQKLFEKKIFANEHKKALNIFCKFIKSKI